MLYGCTSFYLSIQWTFRFVSTFAAVNSLVQASLRSCASKLEEMELLVQVVHAFKIRIGTSLVVQWLRIRLPMQGT